MCDCIRPGLSQQQLKTVRACDVSLLMHTTTRTKDILDLLQYAFGLLVMKLVMLHSSLIWYIMLYLLLIFLLHSCSIIGSTLPYFFLACDAWFPFVSAFQQRTCSVKFPAAAWRSLSHPGWKQGKSADMGSLMSASIIRPRCTFLGLVRVVAYFIWTS